MKIRTLMLGWEFPPFISGGLGTACFGLTQAMDRLGMPVTFVLPKTKPFRLSEGIPTSLEPDEATAAALGFEHVRFRPIPAMLTPYADPAVSGTATTATLCGEGAESSVQEEPQETEDHANYGANIYDEVQRFAERVVELAESEEFELIHAHDWMTFPAGVALAAASSKPLVIQVHSTEFDRSGEHVNQYVYDIERHAMHAATRIIAVSNYTRNIIISRYGIPTDKVEVVYNGVQPYQSDEAFARHNWPTQTDRIVLFLGRITMQKGPEYFLYAAQKVLDKMGNVKFVMAGDGDMLYRMIELAAQLDIGHKVLFTRFLRGDDVHKAYRMADLYVMPSVSEPFGIAPLEALQHNVPILISKQSGIAETFRNALKVDFWDINAMADKMIAVLRHPPLQEVLRSEGHEETWRFRWEDSAARMNEIYHQTLGIN